MRMLLTVVGCAFALSGCSAGTDQSGIAEKTAVPSSAYPLAGFWKQGDCSARFGIAIAPAAGGLYSVSFCGPGGCFAPGTYRPNTKIVGDPQYSVTDNDHLSIQNLSGIMP